MSWDDPRREIHKGLLYRTDDRKNPDPDDERLETFKRGWRYAVYLNQGESPAVYGVNESKALVRTPERRTFWGRA